MDDINISEITNAIFDNNEESTVHNFIRHIRIRRRLSQKQVAGKLKMSQNGYSKIERGESLLTIEKVLEISKVLNFDPTFVMEIAHSVDKIDTASKQASEAEDRLEDLLKYQFSQAQSIYLREISYLKKTVQAQEETIQLLKEKIAMLESKNKS